MNFLAHLYLSGNSDQILLGNFIADFVNGQEAESYRKEVYLGILLHREIDHFTDRHGLVAHSKKKLWHKHRHYSRVIVDVFYDHFLAKNWHNYSDTPLKVFAHNTYSILQGFMDLLPQKAKQVLPHMITNNWLVNYAKLDGVNRAMQGLARRTSFHSEMSAAIHDLQKDYESFEEDFTQFFPQIISHSETFLCTLEESKIYQRNN